jgi:hypothetical protein
MVGCRLSRTTLPKEPVGGWEMRQVARLDAARGLNVLAIGVKRRYATPLALGRYVRGLKAHGYRHCAATRRRTAKAVTTLLDGGQ